MSNVLELVDAVESEMEGAREYKRLCEISRYRVLKAWEAEHLERVRAGLVHMRGRLDDVLAHHPFNMVKAEDLGSDHDVDAGFSNSVR